MSKINNCVDCALTECPFNKSNYDMEKYWDCPDFKKQYVEELEKRNKLFSCTKGESMKTEDVESVGLTKNIKG